MRVEVQLLGWTASALLIATIGAQLHRQWRSQSIQGVSLWLYVGQFTASVSLGVYSVLTRQWVFVVLNFVLALAAILGAGMWLSLRNRNRSGGESPQG